jgi:ribosomal protein L20
MPRSVNHVASRARRKKLLKKTRGYFGSRKNVWTVAKNTWEKGQQYAYRDRKVKKDHSVHCGFSVLTLLPVWKECRIHNSWDC